MRREAGQLQRGPWIVINACKVVSVLGIWSITSAKRRRKSHYVDGDWVTLMSVSLIARPKLLFVNPYLKEHSSWPTDPKCFISFKTKQPRNTNDRSTVNKSVDWGKLAMALTFTDGGHGRNFQQQSDFHASMSTTSAQWMLNGWDID